MKAAALAMALFPCVLACGGLSIDAHGSGGTDASSSVDASASSSDAGASSSDAGAAPDQSANDADAGGESGGPYSGYVIASLTAYQGKQSYALGAAFWTGQEPLPGTPDTQPSCATGATLKGPCCEQLLRLGLPVPVVPPNAGNVTLALHGMPLATLLSPDYAEITSATWNAGDALGVSAAGGDVAAFSGTLLTPAAVAGLSPAFGQDPVAIAHDADLRVVWTPDTNDGEIMQLQIDTIGTGGAPTVLCAVPDSAGSIVVDASLLAPLVSATSASIHLTRSITSSVAARNATVTLEGVLWLSAIATIQ